MMEERDAVIARTLAQTWTNHKGHESPLHVDKNHPDARFLATPARFPR